MRTRAIRSTLLSVFCVLSASCSAKGADNITTPKEEFGFDLGTDYHLANYTDLERYWKKLDAESDRMKLVDIGLTAEGRHQYMAVITSAENHRKLDHYRQISKRLADAEGLTDDEARELAKEGKSVIFMDGGIHSTETVGHQALMELAYQMVSRTDEETMRLLNDDILLLVLANPDGMELVSNWYMQEPDTAKRNLEIPRLYQKYIGHDNARDLFMSNQPETINMNKVLFSDWMPQITHTHHQTGPAGTVVFMGPFRDPFNYKFDPLVMTELDLVTAAMHSRLISKGMPGTAMGTAANYSTWFNGAMRTVSYFHNAIGLLTEVIGSPAPMDLPLVLDHQLPDGEVPFPVAPQKWHFRQSIDYDMEYSRAVLDIASRYRESLLYNRYKMGKNAIERGSTDSWTVTPKRIKAAEAAAAKLPPAGDPASNRGAVVVPSQLYSEVLHDPATRDARGYIIPSNQADFATATKFVNALLKNGITVLRASSDFEVNGKSYPANSFVVKTAQASRPFVMDMFEPQDHPDDFAYPGGPPVPPYDMTGWTLAFSMGVQFDRILDGFEGPFERVEGVQPMPAGSISGPASPAGYLISHRVNNSFTLVNRLLAKKAAVFWLKDTPASAGQEMGTGVIWVPAADGVAPILEAGAKELGVPVTAVASAPAGAALELQPVRIGVVDTYGGNIPSGWTRWIFEQFEFPFTMVFPGTLDEGDLNEKFDVLVFPDGVARFAETGRRRRARPQPSPESIPEEFRGMLGVVTKEKTLPQVERFARAGGTVITIGSSTSMAELLGLGVSDHLVERAPNGGTRPLPAEKYYIPGSIMHMKVNNTLPLAYGMPQRANVMFDNSPVFRVHADSAARRVSSVAWFAEPDVMASGWAWGQKYIDGGRAVVDASLGDGKVVLFGPEVAFRGQAHDTYKLLFNSLFYGHALPRAAGTSLAAERGGSPATQSGRSSTGG